MAVFAVPFFFSLLGDSQPPYRTSHLQANPADGYKYENIQLIRAFHGTESERGFIGVHVQMVENTGRQVKETQNVITAVTEKNREKLNSALVNLEGVLGDINVMMDTMWARSYHADYMKVC